MARAQLLQSHINEVVENLVARGVFQSAKYLAGLDVVDLGPVREPFAAQTAQRKAYTAQRFRRATARIAQEVKEGALQLAVFNDPQLLAMPGGAPIILADEVIGAVGISGLPPAQDALLAEDFARRLS